MAKDPKPAVSNIAQLVEQADITTVAERLGLHIDNRLRRPRRALCPFHNDKDPSLHLYRGGSGQTERDHYHCFVCGAHGDAISLIQNYEKLSFWEAAQRLAEIEGMELGGSRRPVIDRSSGAALLSKRLATRSAADSKFIAFCRERGFEPEFLRGKGAANTNLDELIKNARADRAVEEQLIEAGILRREETGELAGDLYGPRLRGFFNGNRIVLPIDGPRGEPVGFAARALDGNKPKYLYSYDFPRRTSLYGEGRVLHAIRERGHANRSTTFDIFLVEGIFDALRLDQLGFLALAVLGAQITPGQVASILPQSRHLRNAQTSCSHIMRRSTGHLWSNLPRFLPPSPGHARCAMWHGSRKALKGADCPTSCPASAISSKRTARWTIARLA